MTEYKIISSSEGTEYLMEQVEAAAKEGWTPQGGLAIDAGPNWTHFYQAVVRPSGEQELDTWELLRLAVQCGAKEVEDEKARIVSETAERRVDRS